MPRVHRMNSKVGLLQTSERRESSRTPVAILHPKPTEGWVIVGLLSSLKQQVHAPVFFAILFIRSPAEVYSPQCFS